MLQIVVESLYIYFAAAYIIFGMMAFGWLVIHVEHGRHLSLFRVIMSGLFGAIFLGFGLHFLLLAFIM
ncbi:MAG: hypothetical protein BAJATHORv1_30220 [Candidatus Thorarchaeota archaeon]|nr:MAG: hypothetical protein BAJATHORv1_30220 [Candidatus Thorarchaeota archaeon]